jgi:hypothetical protein
MEDSLLQLTAGGILAVLVIREVMGFLSRHNGRKQEKETNANCGKCLEILQSSLDEMKGVKGEVHDLHSWHNVRNPDGGFVWYLPSTLEKAIGRLADNVAALMPVLQWMQRSVDSSTDAVARLTKRRDE